MLLSTSSLRLLYPSIFSSLLKLNSSAARCLRVRSDRSGLIMEGSSVCKLVLCSKSSVENEVAESLKKNNTIKLSNSVDISVSLKSEADKLHEQEKSFDAGLYMNSLSTLRFGRLLIWSPLLTSTHDVVSHNFSELPIGTVCVADVQCKGRGRSKNVWESPVGCLLFSFTIQMEDGRAVPLLQYVVSLAVTEAIRELCNMKGLPYIDTRIKWPNDIYLNGLKVGGILCTSTYRSKKFNISAGIGLNVDNDKPTTCLNTALRAMSHDVCRFTREEIVASFFNRFEELFDLFINQGFGPLENLYYGSWLHSGQRVTIQENDSNQVKESVVTVQGLTSSGYLLAIGEDNQMYELHPDGNSFDFFKGLVRRKLE
ncbi:Biotin--protein ligase 1, chloroplastic [Linum perenne]